MNMHNLNHVIRSLLNAVNMLLDRDLVNAEKAVSYALAEIQSAREEEWDENPLTKVPRIDLQNPCQSLFHKLTGIWPPKRMNGSDDERGHGNVAFLAGVFLLMALAFYLLLALAGHTGAALSGAVNQVVAGSHAVEKHGAAAESIREMFSSQDGRCNRGPSVELRSVQRGTWMYLCFPEDSEKPSSWILSDRIDDPLSREITAIPGKDMSRPVAYLRNVIARDGYDLVNSFGKVPAWFKVVLMSTSP